MIFWISSLAHLGHYHQKFSENYDTIKQLIIGLPPYREIFQHNNNVTPSLVAVSLVANRTATPVQAQRPPSKFFLVIILFILFFLWNHYLYCFYFSVQSTPIPPQKFVQLKSPDTFVFQIVGATRVNFHCISCKMLNLNHGTLKNHLAQNHTMPIVLKCQDCGTRTFHKALNNESEILKHSCSGLVKTELQNPKIQISPSNHPRSMLKTQSSLNISYVPAKQPRLDVAQVIHID